MLGRLLQQSNPNADNITKYIANYYYYINNKTWRVETGYNMFERLLLKAAGALQHYTKILIIKSFTLNSELR